MSMAKSSYNIAIEINNVLAKIQSELRCGICCSTFNIPVVATCNHVFCQNCLEQVFQRRRQIECPLCRKIINKRSCTPSEQFDSVVKGYLQLGRNFRRDLNEQNFTIPKDIAFLESQAILGPEGIDSPMKDFRPMPQFALPKPRTKRRHPLVKSVTSASLKTSKLEAVSESEDSKENDFKESSLTTLTVDTQKLLSVKQELQPSNVLLPADQYIHISNKPSTEETKVAIEKKSVESQCDALSYDYSAIDVREAIRVFRGSQSDHSISFVNDVDILLKLIPGIKEIMLENRSRICELLSIPTVLHPILNENAKVVEPEGNNASQEIYIRNLDTVPSSTNIQDANASNTAEVYKPFLSPRKEAEVVVETPFGSVHSQREMVRNSEVLSNEQECDMDITIAALETYLNDEKSFTLIPPEKVMDEDEAHRVKSMVISVSRLMSRADDNLVHEFRMLFQNVRFEEDIVEGSTHLIMMNTQGRVCQSRSLRYAFAIARQCEIVSRTWMEHCVERRMVISTESYTITSLSNGGIPAWLQSKRAKKPLFSNKKFYLPNSFSDSHLVPREVRFKIQFHDVFRHSKLLELINICGGIHVTKIWELHSSDSYIIFAPDSNERDAARRFESDTKIPVLQADWLLDSISEFRLVSPVDSYRICKKGK